MNKRSAAMMAMSLCLLLGALRMVDLLYLSDPAAGFALVGKSWYRYLIAAAAIAVLFVLSRWASTRPVAIFQRKPALGVTMLLTSAAMLETGTSTLLLMPDEFAMVRGVTLLVSGVWYVIFGIRSIFIPKEKPTSAIFGLAALAAPVWTAVDRFAIQPASLARTGHTLQVLSVLAALAFTSTLLKVIHLPQAPYGRTIAFTGAMAFLFCTCIEVGQTLVSMLAGGAGLLDFVQSFCWGRRGPVRAGVHAVCLRPGPQGAAAVQDSGRQQNHPIKTVLPKGSTHFFIGFGRPKRIIYRHPAEGLPAPSDHHRESAPPGAAPATAGARSDWRPQAPFRRPTAAPGGGTWAGDGRSSVFHRRTGDV